MSRGNILNDTYIASGIPKCSESKRERERENVLMKNILIIQLFSKILKGSAELDRGRCQESWAEK